MSSVVLSKALSTLLVVVKVFVVQCILLLADVSCQDSGFEVSNITAWCG